MRRIGSAQWVWRKRTVDRATSSVRNTAARRALRFRSAFGKGRRLPGEGICTASGWAVPPVSATGELWSMWGSIHSHRRAPWHAGSAHASPRGISRVGGGARLCVRDRHQRGHERCLRGRWLSTGSRRPTPPHEARWRWSAHRL